MGGVMERPILFSGEMVRAILSGRKTETRRIVQSQAKNMQAAGMKVIQYRPPGDKWYQDYVWSMRGRSGVWGDYTHENFMKLCPYGAPGDRLWVRETWAAFSTPSHEYGECEEREGPPSEMPDLYGMTRADVVYQADQVAFVNRWRPSIHMPRWASRINLIVEEVRVERLQDITDEGALREGIGGHPFWGYSQFPLMWSPVNVFRDLWDAINGKRAPWASNPWVWVVSFKREG